MFREFQKKDENAFLELSKELSLFNYENNNSHRLANDDIEERLTNRTKTVKSRIEKVKNCKKTRIYVIEVDMKIVGYIYAYIYDINCIHLEEMYIKEEYRGLGLGSKMLREFEKCSRSKDIKRITLNVYMWNSLGINLYEKEQYTSYYLNMYKNI